MKFLPFLVLAWLFLGAQGGLAEAFSISVGRMAVVPGLVFALVAWIGVWATVPAALWSAILLGLACDLLWGYPKVGGVGGTAYIVGPNALGFFLAMQLILSLRGVMNRKNPMAYGVLAILGSVTAQAIVIAVLSVHRIYGDAIDWQASHEVGARLAGSLSTGVVALVVSYLLLPLHGVMGFPAMAYRPGSRRF
ncbi:MAG: hypothetical protein AB7Q00_08210 [Phycisphaerales bacterium]